MEVQNVSFQGRLYGVIGNHKTKAIICCPHGDRRFIKFVNQIAETKPDALRISSVTDGVGDYKKLSIETTEYPKLSLTEIILTRVNKLQRKALKAREENRINSFIYHIDEAEYYNMRSRYPFISNKELDKFEANIKKLAPNSMKEFLERFFN